LITRGVPCLRRATALAYTDADEDRERLLAIGDLSSTGSEADEWVETHTGRPSAHDSAGNAGEIDDIPDLDGAGDVDHITGGVGKVSLGGAPAEPAETPDLDDIPDMEEELEEGDDEATAAPPKPTNLVQDTAYVTMMSFILSLYHRSRVSHAAVRLKWQKETCFKCELTMS
jgi:ubiquitin-like-conjugating enzyme ATG3